MRAGSSAVGSDTTNERPVVGPARVRQLRRHERQLISISARRRPWTACRPLAPLAIISGHSFVFGYVIPVVRRPALPSARRLANVRCDMRPARPAAAGQTNEASPSRLCRRAASCSLARVVASSHVAVPVFCFIVCSRRRPAGPLMKNGPPARRRPAPKTTTAAAVRLIVALISSLWWRRRRRQLCQLTYVSFGYVRV
jgi:hypothetical protein